MKPIKRIQARTVILVNKDIDTDQIIPARFLTTTSRDGLGKHLFADWRFNKDGSNKDDFVLNKVEAEGCEILVAGNNFGCGSSREHAPWALLDFGFKAVISTEIADIFCNNSLKNGFLPIVVDVATHEWLLENPGVDVSIDVTASTLTLPGDKVIEFPLDGFARYCIVEGIDQLGFLQKHMNKIEEFEEIRTWTP
jgi:3-isopropylmalate/(R)-2-methylmalate dehydratase small subunit